MTSEPLGFPAVGLSRPSSSRPGHTGRRSTCFTGPLGNSGTFSGGQLSGPRRAPEFPEGDGGGVFGFGHSVTRKPTRAARMANSANASGV